MSYRSIQQCANDGMFLSRLEGCAADEGAANPGVEAQRLRFIAAAADDIEAAYESAVLADNPDPGGDPAVITDGMILAVYQASPPESS